MLTIIDCGQTVTNRVLQELMYPPPTSRRILSPNLVAIDLGGVSKFDDEAFVNMVCSRCCFVIFDGKSAWDKIVCLQHVKLNRCLGSGWARLRQCELGGLNIEMRDTWSEYSLSSSWWIYAASNTWTSQCGCTSGCNDWYLADLEQIAQWLTAYSAVCLRGPKSSSTGERKDQHLKTMGKSDSLV